MTASASPGLFGAVSRRGREDADTLLVRMLGGPGGRFHRESLIDPARQWAVGRVHLGVLQPERQLDAANTVHVMFHGDLYNAKDLQREIGGQPPVGHSAVAWLIGELYERLGPNFVQRLDGVFSVSVVDPGRRRVIVATDALASYPIYWAMSGDGLVFGGSLAAVLRYPGVPKALDPGTVADYVTFGHPLGTKTLAADAALVPPGSTLVFDWEAGSPVIARYTNIADAFQPWTGAREEYLEALVDAFRQSVARALSGTSPIGLSLSGGLDSRAILSAVNGQIETLETYTLGVKGCADEVIADGLAAIAHTHHTFFELDDQYLREFLPNLRRLVELTDGMYLSHGLTEMLALGFLSSARFSILLRGHGGELAKTNLAWPLHTDERIEHLSSPKTFVPYMLERANYISRDVDLKDLFTDMWHGQIAGRAESSLERSVADVTLTPADLCSYLYLTEHHRRVTTASLEVFRQVVEIRQPFVDPVFLSVLFRGPASWRADTSIHRTLTRAGNADLLRVRNSNTGASAGAGPGTEWVLDKVNTIFKRLGVPGYRHYHNFQEWMSQQLLSSVDEVLLSRASIERGVLQERGVRRLLDDTRARRADHSHLLQTLLILELWQQQNLQS